MSKMKDAQKEFIIQEALNLFLKKSIVDTTMVDIAREVGIGEATLYRYFKKKQNIILSSVIMLSKKVYNDYFNLKGNTGYEILEDFYNNYLKIYKEHKEYYSFINEFDAIIINEQFDDNLYDHEILNFRDKFFDAYNKGIEDKSINEVPDSLGFYFSTTHALLNLCKKLSLKNIVKSDDLVSGEDELKALIELILYRIKTHL